ncbi:MAG: hypothetical protein ACFB8W_05365 [Elainellaceae cyanobacterium]
MSRLLYEKSVIRRGHLVIPFVYGAISRHTLYSYRLLSEWGHKGKLHKAENPGRVFSESVEGIIDIATEYLEQWGDEDTHLKQRFGIQTDYFKHRYTYRNNLIIIFHANHKYFYDHYPPHALTNIAAPKIFASEHHCLNWIRDGLDQKHPQMKPAPVHPSSRSPQR